MEKLEPCCESGDEYADLWDLEIDPEIEKTQVSYEVTPVHSEEMNRTTLEKKKEESANPDETEDEEEEEVTIETEFYEAAFDGDEVWVEKMLRHYADIIDVNRPNEEFYEWTALHYAARHGHHHLMRFLLGHPAIDVNPRNSDGSTPFKQACYWGQTSCVRLLLGDPRVLVNEPNLKGYTPLRWAASRGNIDTIRHWIVSGREMDLGITGSEESDAIGKASKKVEVAALLRRFVRNPVETRLAVQRELGFAADRLAADVFALVVFVSDGLFEVTTGEKPAAARAARFFASARRLPLELQMILCHYVVGSVAQVIQRTERERAFVDLARIA